MVDMEEPVSHGLSAFSGGVSYGEDKRIGGRQN